MFSPRTSMNPSCLPHAAGFQCQRTQSSPRASRAPPGLTVGRASSDISCVLAQAHLVQLMKPLTDNTCFADLCCHLGFYSGEIAEVIQSCIFNWIWGNNLRHLFCWAISLLLFDLFILNTWKSANFAWFLPL